MVNIKSPTTIKEIEGKFGVSIKGIIGKGYQRQISNTEKFVVIELEKKECVSLIDSNDNILELCRDKKGRYSVRKLIAKSDVCKLNL